MIQRIQTVYLFLASILSLAFIFLNDYVISFTTNVIASFIDLSALVLALLSLITLGLFKNRKLQLTLSLIGIVIAFISAGLYIYIDCVSYRLAILLYTTFNFCYCIGKKRSKKR